MRKNKHLSASGSCVWSSELEGIVGEYENLIITD